jgi:RNAse (barnase) inhibitor barstar
MIKTIQLNTDLIKDWNSFHQVSKKTFGFPDFYGNNMNAWIDCLSDIDDDTGMSNILIRKEDTLVIELINKNQFRERCPEIYLALFECVAFINYRKLELGETALIAISAS